MLDFLFLLLQAAWVVFGATCLVVLVIALPAGVRDDTRSAKSRAPLTQVNAVQERCA